MLLQVCPSLLVKKDRGRPANPKARPKAFGEVHVASNIPGVELLDQDDNGSDDEDRDGVGYGISSDSDDEEIDNGIGLIEENSNGECDDSGSESACSSDSDLQMDNSDDSANEAEDFGSDDNDQDNDYASDIGDGDEFDNDVDEEDAEPHLLETDSGRKDTDDVGYNKSESKKRKFSNFEGQLNVASKSLRALKKLAGATKDDSLNTDDGILSNEDFQRIKELKVWIFYYCRMMIQSAYFALCL